MWQSAFERFVSAKGHIVTNMLFYLRTTAFGRFARNAGTLFGANLAASLPGLVAFAVVARSSRSSWLTSLSSTAW